MGFKSAFRVKVSLELCSTLFFLFLLDFNLCRSWCRQITGAVSFKLIGIFPLVPRGGVCCLSCLPAPGRRTEAHPDTAAGVPGRNSPLRPASSRGSPALMASRPPAASGDAPARLSAPSLAQSQEGRGHPSHLSLLYPRAAIPNSSPRPACFPRTISVHEKMLGLLAHFGSSSF